MVVVVVVVVVAVRLGAGAAGRVSSVGAATVFSDAGFITGIGSVVVATTGSAPTGATTRRGHWKSSARPAGDDGASVSGYRPQVEAE